MLTHLRVSNLAVLADVSIEPARGLTVVTGETGAGKTLLLGGLRLLLGDKSDPSAVGPFGEAAQADGLFVSGELELGVTRVVPAEGRSRAHVDGAIVSAATLQERAGSLVDIVGQHDQISLRQTAHVLALIDSALDDEGLRHLDRYNGAWSRLQEVRKRVTELGGNEMALRQELDLVRFQVTEIDAASLVTDEDRALEAEASRHDNITEINELLAETANLAELMGEHAGDVVAKVRRLAAIDSEQRHVAEQAEGLAANLHDLTTEVRRAAEGVDFDPERAEIVEQRLNLIGALKRKYGPSLTEVISFGEKAKSRLDELEETLKAAGNLESDLREAQHDLEVAGAALTSSRREAANRIALEAERHLSDLGLETARLIVDVQNLSEPGSRGVDQVQILFSSDAHLEPGPISSVASGGELSRLVLAVRLATRSAAAETLVFDEVDAGVGGATALALGRKLASLAETSQILCVTHLPQVAAFADIHYVVTRDQEQARAHRVSGEERLQEISRMLAGLPESTAGQDAAAELLATARTG